MRKNRWFVHFCDILGVNLSIDVHDSHKLSDEHLNEMEGHLLLRVLRRLIPMTAEYDPKGRFFVVDDMARFASFEYLEN
jgi:hypothetical protein